MEPVSINQQWCKGCGICVAFCPKKTLEINREGKAVQARPEHCIRCGMCALYCPDLAVEVQLPAQGDAPAAANEEAQP